MTDAEREALHRKIADANKPPQHPSQADEALNRVLASKPVTLPTLPAESIARRRAITVRGW